MKQNITTTEYNVVERNGQLKFTLNTEKIIPEDAPVRLTDAQLEELDYRRLYSAFSSKGRNPVTDPRVLFKVLAYASEIHVYSNRQIVDACENRIDMIWLLEGEPVPDQSTIARFKQRCASEIEDLFYQYARLLEKQGETDHEAVFIDGTKIESRAGRYTFCWRGSVEKNLEKVKQAVLAKTGKKRSWVCKSVCKTQNRRSLSPARENTKARSSGNGRNWNRFGSAGRGTLRIWKSWEKAETAIPEQTRTQPSCG